MSTTLESVTGRTVEDTARDFWATRPHRGVEDRKIGGVAAALGHRYGLDPVLLRVAFVVATFFSGAGIALYLLGWLLLPEQPGEVSGAESVLGRGQSSMSPVLTVLLGLALIPLTGMVFGGSPFGLIGLALAVAAIFLLHRHRAGSGGLPPAGTTGRPTSGIAEAGQVGTGQTDAASPPPADPPGWDPLGAAPFAWDLPEPAPTPAPAEPAPRPPRSKVTPITLGFALLVGGIATAFWPTLSLVHTVALVLGVIGLGLLVGSVVHGGRGLIGIAIPLAVLTWVLHAVPVSDFTTGDREWRPLTVAEVTPRYTVGAGNGLLDLSELRLADEQTVQTAVSVGAGNARVLLPAEVDVEVSCRAPIGEVTCLGVTDGNLPSRVDERDLGTDGPGGGTLILDVRAGVGSVVVERQT